MARILFIALLGLGVVACGGSSVDREMAASEVDTESSTEEPSAEAPTPVAEILEEPARAQADGGEEAQYDGIVVRVGDRVRLARRVGLITPPAGTNGQQVEAAAGKTGQISAIQDPAGLVEVTWDAQSWTLHGGYAWDGKETIELEDLQGVASRSGGAVEIVPFATTVHLGYLEVLATGDAPGNP